MEANATIKACQGITTVKDIIAAGVSKLSSNDVVDVIGILAFALVGSVVAVCATGSEVAIGKGLFEIRQPHT